MTMAETLFFTQKLTAFAVAIQALEFILLRKEYSEQGYWRWSILRKDYDCFPRFIQKTFNFFFSGPRFFYLSCLHFFTCLLLFISTIHSEIAFLYILLFILCLLTSIRWRGAFNGGNDSMTLILLAAAGLGHLAEPTSIWVRASLLYIAIQVVLSFFISGMAKLRQTQWRTGQALQKFLSFQHYSAPQIVRSFANHPTLCRIGGWLIVLFEVSFPLALMSPALARLYIFIAILFQIANVYLIGLNRFLFTWLAAYPALYFASFR